MNHRVQRVQELIRRELGTILGKTYSFNNCFVTIHEVSMTPDLKQCFVYVGILGDERKHDAIIKKLNDQHGLIQRQLYKRVVLKHSPTLVFKFTDSVERGVRLINIIENLPPPSDDAVDAPGDEVAQ
ncbi:MAG: 30S ribosome-binding factor RbfA [Verrucomicrobiaceae bacterium]